MLIYISYFIFLAFLAIEYNYRPFDNRLVLPFVILMLAFLAGLRGPDIDKDYQNYQDSFIYIDDIIRLSNGVIPNYEPGFLAIVIILKKLFQQNYGVAIMLFYAFSSVWLKVAVIKKYAINPYLVILFYYSSYFLLHEMTQIRIGLASAIFLYSIRFFLKGERLKYILFVLLAALFHYSAILCLLVLIFDTKVFYRFVYLGIIALSFVLAFIKLPLASYVSNSMDPTGGKVDIYITLADSGFLESVHVFNFVTVSNLFCLLYIMFFVPKAMLLSDKKLNLFFKSNLLSIFMLSFFSGVPGFSSRVSEMFAIVSIFLFAYLEKYLPFGKYNVFVLILLAGMIFYITLFYGELLSSYHTVNIK